MNDQTDGIAGHPYATTRTRTYTKGGWGRRNARIDKARTDKDVIITYLNIDQLKLDIRVFDKKREQVSRCQSSRSGGESHTA